METLKQIALTSIVLSKHNPRRIDPKHPNVDELAKSIDKSTLFEPVICRPIGGDKVELLAGARRYYAHVQLKRETILARVIDLADREAIEVTVIENLQRADLAPLEEARGVRSLLDTGHDPQAIANDIGKSLAWVYRRAKLVDLIPEFVKAVEKPGNAWHGASAGHLELIARLPAERQKLVLGFSWMAGRPVPEVARRLEDEEHRLKSAPFPLDDAGLGGQACGGACVGCLKRTDSQPALFHEPGENLDKAARCLDGVCWSNKMTAFIRRRMTELADSTNKPVILIHGNDAGHAYSNAFKGALDSWSVRPAKAGAPGAKLALIVDGSRAGQQLYITKPKLTSMGGERKCTVVPLSKRRQAWIIRHVENAIMKAPPPFTSLADMAALIVGMGTSYTHRDLFYTDSTIAWNTARALNKVNEAIIAALWKAVQPVLKARLRYFTVTECGKQYKEALEQATLINLGDEKALLKLATAALPDPAKPAAAKKSAKSTPAGKSGAAAKNPTKKGSKSAAKQAA